MGKIKDLNTVSLRSYCEESCLYAKFGLNYEEINIAFCLYCGYCLTMKWSNCHVHIFRWPQLRKERKRRGGQPSTKWWPESTPSMSTNVSMECKCCRPIEAYAFLNFLTKSFTPCLTSCTASFDHISLFRIKKAFPFAFGPSRVI